MTEPVEKTPTSNSSSCCPWLLKWSALFMLLPLLGLVFLLSTEMGLQVLLRSANQLAGPYFSAEQAEGRLLDHWRLRNIRIQIKNAVAISLDDFSMRWNPKALLYDRALHIRQIAAHGLIVRILDSDKKDKKAHKWIVLPKIHLPLGLQLDELRVAKSKIVAEDGKDALLIHTLLLQGAAHDDQAELIRLKAETSQFSADLRGKVQFNGAWPVQVGGNWRVPDHGINELVGTVAAQGDFDKVAVSATMTSPAKVTLKGRVTNIFNDLHWQAAAETGHFSLRDIKVDVPVNGNLRIVQAAGTVKSYGGVLAAEIHHQGYPTVQAEAKVTAADYTGLKVDYLTVRHEAAELLLRGDMHWKGGFSWQAELKGKELDPALVAAGPGKINGQIRSNGKLAKGKQELYLSLEEIQGELRGLPFKLGGKLALVDKSLTIDGLALHSGSSKVQINGKVATDKTIDLAVQAEAPHLGEFLPGSSGAAQLKGTVVGNFAQAALQLNLNGSGLRLQERKLPDLQADLRADLSLRKENSGLHVHDFRLLADGKSALNINGQLGWTNGLSWQAEVKAAELDPALIVPDWPGTINAELHSQGHKSAAKLIAEIQLDTLTGKLRGFPLIGSGKAKLDGKALTVDALRLQSGSTYVQLNGKGDPEKELALTFKAGSQDLASLAPAAGGKFQLEGAISGSPQQPSLSLTANGTQLRMQEYSLKELKAAVKADLSPSGQVDAEIKATDIQVKQQAISEVKLRLKGSAEQHRLDFAATGSPGTVQLVAAGGWQEQKWQGQLVELELINKQFGTWKTEKAADLTLSAASCALSGFALVQDKARAAVNGQWQKASGWQAQSQLDHLSLALLKQWQIPVPENFPEMQGVLAVSAAAQGQGRVPQQAELTLALPELALTAENYDEDDGKTTWRWQNNHLSAQLKDNTLRLTGQTKFQDGSTAVLEATANNCGDFSKLEQMQLAGLLTVNIMDIAPLTQLTGYTVQTQGGFGGVIDLRGTAARPQLDGHLALKKGVQAEGKIHLPAAGINLHKLQLAVAGDGSNNQLDVIADSGQGRIRVSGEINRQPGQPLAADFTIKGENFQAVALPEYQIVLSPDLRLAYNGKGTVLTGTLLVPKARIAPLGFSGAAASSKDVVVIDGEEKPLENSLPFSAAIAVELGQEVAVDAFGIKGFLDGGLKINAKPDQIVTALGALSLRETSVAFEGVALQLNEGRIFYQGGPIDNPGLDIRASKKVNRVEAGIHLTGSVDDMNIKLFSDTPMEDSEILSWLLSGQNGVSSSKGDTALSPAAAALSKMGGGALLKSVNPLGVVDMEDFVDLSIGGGKEASDVSLVMSKEIYKDLYISYGKDLTGEGGSFKARYDLKYGFSVESETTSKTTGADLIWSLER
ncbi:translocation/assembly module TamB domain-containing protein [Candidatus Electronema sp. PJ]|uniref:translocation/assembly module TamB domain-containing protein n=1 Tax=Candidatus Electronema sp. PJ TaxID=3401572 RepID=UPI003AA98DB5